MTKEQIEQSTTLIADVELTVLRTKFAEHGINPETEEQGTQLLARVSTVMATAPRLSAHGQQMKSASASVLGMGEQKLAQDGFSEEAHRIVDNIMKVPVAVEAMRIALSAQTV